MWSFTWQWKSQTPGLFDSLNSFVFVVETLRERRLREAVEVLLEERALVLVHHREEGEELAAHVPGATIRPGHAPCCDFDRPMSPAHVSDTSSTWEWYIHITEPPSSGPGPARCGTSHV